MIYFADTHRKKIFTTGAFLKPMKVKDANGNDFWIWAVDEFVGSSYSDGNEYTPLTVAGSVEELLVDQTI